MSLEKLPNGWLRAELVNLAYFIDYRGKTPKKTREGIPLVTAKNIRDGYINREPREYIAEADYDSWMTRGTPQIGDLVITTEAPMGNVAILNIYEKFALAQRAICLSFNYKENVSKFIFYYLRTQSFKNNLVDRATGTTVQGIKAAELKKILLPVAPLPEQQQIATLLDQHLAQVEQIKARLAAIPALLKKFRQSVLADAVSGKLLGKKSDYRPVKFEELIVSSNNGISKRSGESGKKITVLRLADFKNAIRVHGGERQILLNEHEVIKYKLNQNDILIIRVNGSVDLAGKFILYRVGDSVEAFCDHFIRLQLDESVISAKYLLYVVNEGEGRNYIVRSLSTSAGQNTINQTSIKSLTLLLPSLEEQTEIVRRVEQLFAHVDHIEKSVLEAQKRVNNLTQSILAKAFSGQLTAAWREQNPDLISGDNSAAKLLERIQLERKANSNRTKKTKGVKA